MAFPRSNSLGTLQRRQDHYAALRRSGAFVALVFAASVVGYLFLGPNWTLVDAVYMTLISVTTVGYGEAGELDQVGRIFTMVMLIFGVTSVAFLFSNLTAFIVEGHLEQVLWGRTMNKRISALSDHFIVCGAGATGRHIIAELAATGRPFVLVEEDEIRARHVQSATDVDFPVVVGDATDDDTLIEAGMAAGPKPLLAAFFERERRRGSSAGPRAR